MQPSEPSPVVPQVPANGPKGVLWYLTALAMFTTAISQAESTVTTISKYWSLIYAFVFLAVWTWLCYCEWTRSIYFWNNQLMYIIVSACCWQMTMSSIKNITPINFWISCCYLLVMGETAFMAFVVAHKKENKLNNALAAIEELKRVSGRT